MVNVLLLAINLLVKVSPLLQKLRHSRLIDPQRIDTLCQLLIGLCAIADEIILLVICRCLLKHLLLLRHLILFLDLE